MRYTYALALQISTTLIILLCADTDVSEGLSRSVGTEIPIYIHNHSYTVGAYYIIASSIRLRLMSVLLILDAKSSKPSAGISPE